MIKHQNSPEVKQFIRENKELFWYIRKDAIEDISNDTLVEFILNYGDIVNVKKMFDLLGIENVANIFYKQINNQHKFNRKKIIISSW